MGTVERRKHTTKTGGALYFEVGIDQLLHHLDTFRFQAKFDDRAVDGESILFAIQIGPTYGGGFKVCPEADPTDGIFDICYAQAPISLPRAILTFARAKNGKHVGTRGMCFDAAQTISLHFETEPPAQADGEKVTGTDFDICMHPSALRVFVA